MKTTQPSKRIPKRTQQPPKWYKLLCDFNRSTDTEIELVPEPGEYKSLKIAQSVVCTAVKRYGFKMRTVRDGEHLYLIKSKSVDKPR